MSHALGDPSGRGSSPGPRLAAGRHGGNHGARAGQELRAAAWPGRGLAAGLQGGRPAPSGRVRL